MEKVGALQGDPVSRLIVTLETMDDTSVIVLECEDLKYSFQLRYGLVNRVGKGTPRTYLGRDFQKLIPLLTKKGFTVSRILT